MASNDRSAFSGEIQATHRLKPKVDESRIVDFISRWGARHLREVTACSFHTTRLEPLLGRALVDADGLVAVPSAQVTLADLNVIEHPQEPRSAYPETGESK
jgi:hypothetical protein